jgi:RNase adapter protein RapZ
MTEVVVITGLSGAGRSQAAGVLEDLGWYVVDNLPTSLIDTIVDLASAPGSGIPRLALVAGRQHAELLNAVAHLRANGHHVRVLYLDADSPELVRRYENTRRRHPLANETTGVLDAIEIERASLEPVKNAADILIDTTQLNVHQFRDKLIGAFETAGQVGRMQLAVQAFGFKYGLPLDADMVMDVRFLPNPYWAPELRALTGLDEAVRDYVLHQPATKTFIDRLEQMLVDLIPAYIAEGKSYLTVAIGCTGGRHRSVVVAEELARHLAADGYPARVMHRDIGR